MARWEEFERSTTRPVAGHDHGALHRGPVGAWPSTGVRHAGGVSPGPRAYLIGVDGRSGSGKTDLSTQIAATLGGASGPVPVVNVDEMVPGWHGLRHGIDRLVDGVLVPLTQGSPALLRRWDWVRDIDGDPLEMPWAPLVVVEGVGVGAARCRPYLSCLLWLELGTDERYRRAMARDGEQFRPWWDVWAAHEDRYLVANDPRSHADVVVRT